MAGPPAAMGATPGAAAAPAPMADDMDDGMGGMPAGGGAMAGPPAAMGATPGGAAAPAPMAPMADDMDDGMGGMPAGGGMAAPAGGGGMMAMMGMCCGSAPVGASKPGMPGMPADAKTGADPSSADAGMGAPMGKMGKMSGKKKMVDKKGMSMPTLPELAGFPGAPDLYHVGSVDFFLDLADALALTAEQKTELEKRRADARTATAATAAQIIAAEKRLWALTGSDRPVADRIVATVTEIERLKTTQRLEFMRAVGGAIAVLGDAQRSCSSGWAESSGTGMIDTTSTPPATCPGAGS